MIKIVPMMLTSDGKAFQIEDEAKAHEIAILPDIKSAVDEETIAWWIVKQSAAIVSILTSKPIKRMRKKRSDAGTTRTGVQAAKAK
jgi:hypothetical protein